MKYIRLLVCLLWLFPFGFINPVQADANIWTGTNNFNWSNASGWSLGHTPLAGEDVAITNRTIVLEAPTEQLGSFVLTSASLLFTNWTTVLQADTIDVGNGGVLTLPAAFTNGPVTNRINVACATFLLQTGGVVNADIRGFAS